MTPFSSILVATDFSVDGNNAVRRAALLAHEHGTRPHILHVLDAAGCKPLREWFSPTIDIDLKAAQARAALRRVAVKTPVEQRYRCVLMPVDFTASSDAAVQFAAPLAHAPEARPNRPGHSEHESGRWQYCRCRLEAGEGPRPAGHARLVARPITIRCWRGEADGAATDGRADPARAAAALTGARPPRRRWGPRTSAAADQGTQFPGTSWISPSAGVPAAAPLCSVASM